MFVVNPYEPQKMLIHWLRESQIKPPKPEALEFPRELPSTLTFTREPLSGHIYDY